IRLVGGSRCSGRLEVPHGNTWMSVCAAAFDQQDAEVVCRELGCGAPVQVLGEDAFGKGNAQMWTQEIQCRGNEYQFALCPMSPSHSCSHDNDVSVICAEFKEIRLTEGCEGNVEVFYNGSWGNLCYNKMDRDTASLICQELNCGRSASEPNYSEGLKSHNWLDKLNCRSHDSTLWQCPSSSWGLNDCDNEVVNITCSGYTDLRLVSGPDTCSGRVERQYFSKWGTVCDACWDMRAASVLCRQLNCGIAVSVVGSDWFGEGNLSVSTTPATTTSSSPPVSQTVSSTSVSRPQTPPAASLSVSVIVLGVVLLLLLVPLLILIQQNRVMRRALSKRRHRSTTEAVYEEIHHRHNHFTQRGSLISEELHSGYEDADELLSEKEFKTVYYDDVTNGLKEEMKKEITPGYYDDVITDGLKPDRETEDTPESYDDVMTSGQNFNIKKVDTLEHYDDVIINGQSIPGVTEGDQEEYDDVKNSDEDERNLLDYDDVGEESNKEGGAL
ncbi:hypothetical protein ABG768_021037, partial [Culter alburnus]